MHVMALYKFAVSAAVVYTVFGADASQQCPEGELCLTSFRQCDNHEGGCGQVPDSYAWADPNGTVQPPTLFSDTDYAITWVFGPNGQVDVPVRIQWQMSSVVWETSKHSRRTVKSPARMTLP